MGAAPAVVLLRRATSHARKAMRRGPRLKPPPKPPPPPASKAGKAAAAAAVGSSMAPARKQPVILRQKTRPRVRCAELAGGTTADCASVICCGPCMVMNVLLLTVVRIPVGICHRAKQAQAKRKAKVRKRKEERLLLCPKGQSSAAAEDEEEADSGDVCGLSAEEVAQLEEEMWAHFRGAGFWRSPSQKSDRVPFSPYNHGSRASA